ncbi:MAG TPA: nuclear transport factor 2 family protein [Gammaproteobacteria bacterium]|nr:nuclear transport factor 2 family protein [Gammaproteobacteria bacterium]
MSIRIAAAALCLVASAGLQAQAPTAAPRELTALDYIEIQQLVARYARAIDTCSNNGYDYADLFTADGAFIPSFEGKQLAPIQGRDRLAAVSGGGSNGCKDVPWIEQGVRHIYTNHVIVPTPDGASATVDMLMIGLGGDPNKIEYDGHYEDTYVKTPQGWRFKQRVHHALLREGQRVTPAPAAQKN